MIPNAYWKTQISTVTHTHTNVNVLISIFSITVVFKIDSINQLVLFDPVSLTCLIHSCILGLFVLLKSGNSNGHIKANEMEMLRSAPMWNIAIPI